MSRTNLIEFSFCVTLYFASEKKNEKENIETKISNMLQNDIFFFFSKNKKK